jgi:hypothetical protein
MSFSTLALTPPTVTDWVADSSFFFFFCQHSYVVGNGCVLLITLVGDTLLPSLFYHNNILVVSDIIQNLLFVSRFTIDNRCTKEFDPFCVFVKDLSTQNVITRCNSLGPLCTLRLPTILLIHVPPRLRS